MARKMYRSVETGSLIELEEDYPLIGSVFVPADKSDFTPNPEKSVPAPKKAAARKATAKTARKSARKRGK